MIKDILEIISKEFFNNNWDKKDGDKLQDICDLFYENNRTSLPSSDKRYTIDVIDEYCDNNDIEFKVFKFTDNGESVLLRFEGERTPYGLEYQDYPVLVVINPNPIYLPIYDEILN